MNASLNISGSGSIQVAGENDLEQNPDNLAAERGPSLFDARHRFVFSYQWSLPFWQHQPFIMQAFIERAYLPRVVPLLRRPYSTKRLLLEIVRARKQRLPLLDNYERASV